MIVKLTELGKLYLKVTTTKLISDGCVEVQSVIFKVSRRGAGLARRPGVCSVSLGCFAITLHILEIHLINDALFLTLPSQFAARKRGAPTCLNNNVLPLN